MNTKNMFSVVRFISLLTLIAASTYVNAQQYVSAYKNSEGLWGYLNSEGEVLIEARFDKVFPFCKEGISLVRYPDSVNLTVINLSGEEIEPNFSPSVIKAFHSCRAVVEIDDSWGYMNPAGELIIEAKWDKANHFSEDRAFVKDESGQIYLLDENGNNIDISSHGIIGTKDFNEGLAAVRLKNRLWGFINKSGELVVEAKFIGVGKFSDGLAWVRITKTDLAFINTSGEIVFEPDVDRVQEYDKESGLIRVKNDDDWYYINLKGEQLRTDAYKFNDFSEGLVVSNTEGVTDMYGYKNNKGEWVIEQKFEKAKDFTNGMAMVMENDLWGLIDKQGNYLIEPKHEGLQGFVLVE